jgi:hypothetical protein
VRKQCTDLFQGPDAASLVGYSCCSFRFHVDVSVEMCYQSRADMMGGGGGGGGGLFWAIGGSHLSAVGMQVVLIWQVALVSAIVLAGYG